MLEIDKYCYVYVVYGTRGVGFGVGLAGWLMKAHDGMLKFPNTKECYS